MGEVIRFPRQPALRSSAQGSEARAEQRVCGGDYFRLSLTALSTVAIAPVFANAPLKCAL